MVIGLLQSQQGGFCNGNPEGNEGRNGVTPSLQYHEKLVKVLCMNKRYDVVVNLIEDLERVGLHVSSFIGNVYSCYILWRLQSFLRVGFIGNLMLGQLSGSFLGSSSGTSASFFLLYECNWLALIFFPLSATANDGFFQVELERDFNKRTEQNEKGEG